MFLDEELEKIYEEHKFDSSNECTKQIIQTCVSRMGNVNEIGTDTFINNVKRVELRYRMFAKRHSEYKEDGLRALIIYKCGDAVKKALNWK